MQIGSRLQAPPTPNPMSVPSSKAPNLIGTATRRSSSNDLSISSAARSSPTGYAPWTTAFNSAIAVASARVSAL